MAKVILFLPSPTLDSLLLTTVPPPATRPALDSVESLEDDPVPSAELEAELPVEVATVVASVGLEEGARVGVSSGQGKTCAASGHNPQDLGQKSRRKRFSLSWN